MNSLAGKVAVVTGPTGGLGGAVVRKLASEGARLALIDYSTGRMAEMFTDLDDPILVEGVDVTDPEQVEAALNTCLSEAGRIDILVNIAGGWRGGTPVHETDASQWDFVMNLNAKSVFLVSRAVIPHMLEQGGGKIVSIAARSGLKGRAKTAIYTASKSAVIRLTEAMSEEYKEQGINVNAVLPSTIDTEPNRKGSPGQDYSKWVAPESLADVIAFLVSDAARDIHGVALPVSGLV